MRLRYYVAAMSPLTILVADDDATTSLLIATALRKDGYNVITAVDAMQATMASLRSRPAAIVLDVQMPGGTGLDVIRKIKMSNLTSQTPIVVISSLSDPELPDKVRGMGADEFLPKPVDLDRLRAELKRLLEPPASSPKPR
jgi:DNA-binding response OmpR family regulator